MNLKLILIIVAVIISGFYFNETTYENIGKTGDPNFWAVLKWKFSREKPIWPELPAIKPDIPKPNIPEIVNGDDIVVTYINHSTVLIQTAGKNIITDPIWSMHAGPFGKYGVRRSIYPGVNIEDLPKIDVILISHSHYDHLDLSTIEEITRTNQPIILTGLGVTKYIDYCKSPEHCYELEWWENTEIEEAPLTIHFVPAYHWSSRHFFDKNTTLWGGFVIANQKDHIYFAGDTGFGDGEIFRQLKEKFGHFKLALLPIGAYKPNDVFLPMHTSPAQAVEVAEILDSSYTIPIHFDTFELTDDQYNDPLTDLQQALQNSPAQQTRFNVLSAGGVWQAP